MTAVAFDPTATDFGTDAAWDDDLAPVWGLSSGADNYIQSCLLRLSQRTGSMDFYDPTYVCLDLRGYLNAKTSQADKSRLQGRISAAMQSDPRTQSCTASISFDVPTNTLTVALALQTADGPFDLVLQANKVNVSILTVNGVTAPAPIVPAAGGATVIVITGGDGSNQPGPPGPPGSSNPSRSFGLQPVSDNSGAEVAQPQTQMDVNWGALGSSLTIEVTGTGASDAGSAVFRLRRDGSDGAADGTIIATLTASSPSFTQIHGGSTISNPGGYGRVILTVESSGASSLGSLRDIGFTIQSN